MTTPGSSPPCDSNNGGISLPPGFCATIFADEIGRPRHIGIASNGRVYVMLAGGAIMGLQDTDADGHADIAIEFGRRGSSGLAIQGDALFADIGSAVVRYQLSPGLLVVPSGIPDTIVRGIPTTGHTARSLALDDRGNIFVSVGSVDNACETTVRDPCGQLPTRAGIWRFSASAIGQTFSPAARYATGIRNAVALATGPGNSVWAVQHGRDNLRANFPSLFTVQDGADNPAEEMFRVEDGDDFGWPYCYYDFRPGKRVMAPDYGGDRIEVGRCAGTKSPIAVFPGHWAPNGMVFYTSNAFPARYRGGAFVAFHGSHNRTPLPQAGFLVAFVPPSGSGLGSTYEVFADGFAGQAIVNSPLDAAHRPTGLALDSSGALYITDDWGGRIWRIVYRQP